MQEIDRQSPAARVAFRSLDHSRSIVFATLDGSCPGRVFVSGGAEPTSALLLSATGFAYLAGSPPDRAFAVAAVERLLGDLRPRDGWVFLFGCSAAADALAGELLAAHEPIRARRFEYTLDPARFRALGDWRRALPEGCRVAALDESHAARDPSITELWGSVAAFLARGLGYAVLRGDDVLSRCAAVACGDGRAEVSVETVEAERGRGLATIAASAFIEGCRARGLVPAWSCWDDNVASQALAARLGFGDRREVAVWIIRGA